MRQGAARLRCSPSDQQKKKEEEEEQGEEGISLDQAETLAQALANLVANPASYLVAAVVVAGFTSQIKVPTGISS